MTFFGSVCSHAALLIAAPLVSATCLRLLRMHEGSGKYAHHLGEEPEAAGWLLPITRQVTTCLGQGRSYEISNLQQCQNKLGSHQESWSPRDPGSLRRGMAYMSMVHLFRKLSGLP